MSALPSPTSPSSQIPFGATSRRDNWWVEPLLNFIGFTTFVIYSLWVTFTPELPVGDLGQVMTYKWPPVPAGEHGSHGWVYLSPFFSPEFGGSWWKYSPAILVLWMPLGFRATCYYYRKMYYRTYFMDPPGCAVGDHKGHKYAGETAFPWILQNAHRWFLYLAIYVVAVLWFDALRALWIPADAAAAIKAAGGEVSAGFHFGIGNAIMLLNAAFLSFYTFGCHALRHLVGGNIDCWSCTKFGKTRHKLWTIVTRLNEHHMFWAWVSMIVVGLTDLYVRMLVLLNVPFKPWL
ncbi:MAG: succinate dehydrogenase [Candidatus Sericytochromatia bacterium]|nr:succinate dehydrogenase [Candidatus Tanganyikabacteria bacterium]